MNPRPIITRLFNRFRHHGGGRIDVISDPYKIWLRLCVLFVILLIAVFATDWVIFQKIQTGKLVQAQTNSLVPTPIISETELTKIAAKYTARAEALNELQQGSSTVSSVDPSK